MSLRPMRSAATRSQAPRNASPSRQPCHIVPKHGAGPASARELARRRRRRRDRGGSRSRDAGTPSAEPAGAASTFSARTSCPRPSSPRPATAARPGPRPRRGRRSPGRASGSRRRCPSTDAAALTRGPARRRRARARAATPGRRSSPGCRAARRRRRRQATRGSATKVTSRPGSRHERVDVGEVADPRQPHHGHPQPAPAVVGRRRPITDRRASPRSPATGRAARAARRAPAARSPSRRVEPGLQQPRVAAELVDHQARRPAPGRPRSSSARVPCIAANTPPRSMSPTSTAGIPACRASPMLT